METIKMIIDFLVANQVNIIIAVTAIVAITPTEKDDNAVQRIKNILGKLKPTSK